MISKVLYKSKDYSFAKKKDWIYFSQVEGQGRLAAASTGLDNEIDTLVVQGLQKSEILRFNQCSFYVMISYFISLKIGKPSIKYI